MASWHEATVEELCTEVTSGGTPSRKRDDFYADDGIPWVKSKELQGARITRTEEFITHAGLEGSSAKILPPDTVLMAMYGANVGKLGWLGIEATVNQAVCAMITDPQVTDSRFLYYALAGTRANLITQAHGAAQQNLSQQLIKPFVLRIPDIETQRQIGFLLRSIDDLIENNRRRVELLEEMARAIYREWFVKFRYPGHEDVPLVDSALGPIPEGWGVSTLFEMAEITMGHSPKSDFYNTDGIGKPFHQGVSDFGPHFPSTRRWCSIDGRSAKPGDILLSVRAPVGRINLADTDITIGRGISAIRAKDGRQALLLGHLREAFVDEDSMGNDGAIFKSLGKAELAALPIVVAPEKIADAANAALTDNVDILRVLTQTNRRLVTIRELLLPKLVTGQIDVSTINLDTLASTVSVDDEEVA